MTDFDRASHIEQTLHGAEESYRRLVELSPDGIAVLSEGRLVFVNRAGVQLIGALRAEELARKPILDLVEPASRLRVETGLRQIGEGRPTLPLTEGKLLRLDGTMVDVEMAAVPFTYRGKPAAQILFRDITQRKQAESLRLQLEEKLRLAERMEAIGRAAGGVAHDFNNHLNIIQGSAHLLLARLATDDPRRADAERIKRTAEKGTQLIRQLLTICGGQPAEPQLLDLTQVVSDMVPMLRLLLGERLTLRVQLAPALWSVRADRGQVERVVINLVTNARDAILSGGSRNGRLTVETANVEANADARPGAKKSPRSEPTVMLAVSDNGCGMELEVRQRIFEPFFTTKEPGKGTGLGLSIVHEIVRQHDGSIVCESEPGYGTTFRIYLPCHSGPAQALSEEASRPAARLGGARRC